MLVLLTGLLSIAAGFTAACSKTQTAEAGTAKVADAPVVAVAKASTGDLSQNLTLTAEFLPFQEVDVMAKVAGYVKTIRVDVGDRVKQGELLATLEIPEMVDDRHRGQAALDHSKAEVARAKDQLEQAQSAHEIAHLSYQRLFEVSKQKPGLIAQQEIDDAQGKDLVAEAQIAAARSNLAAADQQVQVSTAELHRIKTMYEYTSVVAPFAGVITKRFANTGSMIQAGTASSSQAMPVVRLSENSLLRLILPVPESAVPTVHIGQEIRCRVPAMKRDFTGRVARFADRINLATRTMDTEVDVPNPSLGLIPGMYAEVHLTLARRNSVLAIPVSAVEMLEGTASARVVVVTPQSRVEIRKVQVGLETPDEVEIQFGLKEGDLVVIGNRSGLQPGQEVRPKLTVVGSPSPA